MRCPVLKVSAMLLGARQRFNKERFHLVENLRSARCSPVVIFKVLAARMTKLITARIGKNKRTARMLAGARKDHLIPLVKRTFILRNLILAPSRSRHYQDFKCF